VTALRLQNSLGGVWDTVSPNAAWLLGVATSLDGPLLNDITTMAWPPPWPMAGACACSLPITAAAGFTTGATLTIIATLATGRRCRHRPRSPAPPRP